MPFLLALAVAVTACLGAVPAAGEPTFARDVAPIFQQHCQECHRAGGAAPFHLLSYEQAYRRREASQHDRAGRKRHLPALLLEQVTHHRRGLWRNTRRRVEHDGPQDGRITALPVVCVSKSL